jgi:hypothetical protein
MSNGATIRYANDLSQNILNSKGGVSEKKTCPSVVILDATCHPHVKEWKAI